MKPTLRHIVDQGEIQALWPWAAPWLDKAIGEEGSLYDLGVIKSWLESGQLQLWIAEDGPGVPIAFLVTEVVTEGPDKVLSLRWIGGREMEKWLGFLKAIEYVAMWNKVTKIEVYGRKGWERTLKPYGYTFKSIVLGKRLNYSQSLN